VSDDFNQLRVFIDGNHVGDVVVTGRGERRLFGRFLPGDGFNSQTHLFDEAFAWSRQFEESHDDDSLDYSAFDRYIGAIRAITSRITIPQIESDVEEFAVDHRLEVEITFHDRNV
jgi:hypothetical protein